MEKQINNAFIPTSQQVSNTLFNWLNEWIETHKMCTVRTSTLDMYRYSVQLIQACKCADTNLSDISQHDLQKVLNEICLRRQSNNMKSPYSESTLRKVRMTLNQAFRVARKAGLVNSNPADELILPHAPTKEVLPLTHDQQERVEIACRNDVLGFG